MKRSIWLGPLTEMFLRAVDGLSDAALAEDVALPGWTRIHVVAHVHYNAEALRRLVRWAATGRETRMYADVGQRRREIDEGALMPPARLRSLVHASAAALAGEFDALPPPAMRRTVITAHGREVPAEEIAWLRSREVGVHAVDLRAGVAFADLPDEFNTALVHDVLTRRAAAGESAVLAEWLTGRTQQAPQLGPWL